MENCIKIYLIFWDFLLGPKKICFRQSGTAESTVCTKNLVKTTNKIINIWNIGENHLCKLYNLLGKEKLYKRHWETFKFNLQYKNILLFTYSLQSDFYTYNRKTFVNFYKTWKVRNIYIYLYNHIVKSLQWKTCDIYLINIVTNTLINFAKWQIIENRWTFLSKTISKCLC